jgi:bacteriocin-like protein
MRDQSTYPNEHQKPSSADAPAKAAVTEMTELSDEQLDSVSGGGLRITMQDVLISSYS